MTADSIVQGSRTITERLSDLFYRMKQLAKNSGIAFRAFEELVQLLVKEWLWIHLDATFFFFRVEAQQRGSLHVHGLAHLASDPVFF